MKLVWIAGLLAANVGCHSVVRGVSQDNLFRSSSQPKIEVRVDSRFNYLGEVNRRIYEDYVTSPGGSHHKQASYIFAHSAKDNTLAAVVIIVFSKIEEGYYLPDLFSRIKNKLNEGIEKVHGKSFQYCSFTSSSPLEGYQEVFILDKGYLIPNCFMVKAIARKVSIKGDALIKIMYAEDVFHVNGLQCRDWKARNKLTGEQCQFLEEFLARSENSFQILP